MAASDETWESSLQSEDIIREVKNRPILYNKSLPEYNNKMLKNKIWEDIVKSMSSDWEGLTDLVRTVRCRDIQTKWKHIRDNFRRDCTVDKDISYRNGKKKKKKYRYSNQLSFLMPYIIDTNTSGKDSSKQREDNTDLLQEAVPTKRKHSPERNFEFEVLEAISKRNVEPDDDDDRAFCMSLVKPMKKIDDANKLTARMEILNVIRKFSYPEKHLLYSQQCRECTCAASQVKRIKNSENRGTQSGHDGAGASNISVEQSIETYSLSEEVILPVDINEVKLEVEDE